MISRSGLRPVLRCILRHDALVAHGLLDLLLFQSDELQSAFHRLHEDTHRDGEHGDSEDHIEDAKPRARVGEIHIGPLPGQENGAPIHRGWHIRHISRSALAAAVVWPVLLVAYHGLVLPLVLHPHEQGRGGDPNIQGQIARHSQLGAGVPHDAANDAHFPVEDMEVQDAHGSQHAEALHPALLGAAGGQATGCSVGEHEKARQNPQEVHHAEEGHHTLRARQQPYHELHDEDHREKDLQPETQHRGRAQLIQFRHRGGHGVHQAQHQAEVEEALDGRTHRTLPKHDGAREEDGSTAGLSWRQGGSRAPAGQPALHPQLDLHHGPQVLGRLVLDLLLPHAVQIIHEASAEDTAEGRNDGNATHDADKVDELGRARVVCFRVVAEQVHDAVLQRRQDASIPMNHRQLLAILSFSLTFSFSFAFTFTSIHTWEMTKDARTLANVEQRGVDKPNRHQRTASSRQGPSVQDKHTLQAVHRIEVALQAEGAEQSEEHHGIHQHVRVLVAWSECTFSLAHVIDGVNEGNDGEQIAKPHEGNAVTLASAQVPQLVLHDEPYRSDDVNNGAGSAHLSFRLAELVSFPLLHGGDDGDDRRHGHQEHTHSPDPAEEQRWRGVHFWMEILVEHVVDLLFEARVLWATALLPGSAIELLVGGGEITIRLHLIREAFAEDTDGDAEEHNAEEADHGANGLAIGRVVCPGPLSVQIDDLRPKRSHDRAIDLVVHLFVGVVLLGKVQQGREQHPHKHGKHQCCGKDAPILLDNVQHVAEGVQVSLQLEDSHNAAGRQDLMTRILHGFIGGDMKHSWEPRD
mmetsp:Transcript_85452/g.204787  ORF Transcript_85452/g.204787 Transcript_85452/m.204787 type:complete len:805 (-) Transcript_85452:1673-4087(-)